MRFKINGYLTKRSMYYIVSILVLLALIVLGTIFLGPPIMNFAKDPKKFREYIESFGFMGRFVFIGIQILQIVFAVIPGEIIEIGAGYAYGAWEGMLLCLIGALIASTGIFLLVRKLGKRFVTVIASSQKLEKFKFLHNEKQLFLIVFLLFFIPGTPKDLLTYFIGLTKIKTSHFLIIATFARIPSVLSSTYAGATLNDKDYKLTAIISAIMLVVSVIGILIYRYIITRKEKKSS